MKRVLTLLLVCCCSILSAQEVLRVDSLHIQSDVLYAVDQFNNYYFGDKRSVYKYNKKRLESYQNLKLGNIHKVDVINPLKIVLFYKDFNTAVILDNQMNEISKIDFSLLNTPLQLSYVAHSANNKLWGFDQISRQLVLIDAKTNKVQFINQALKDSIIIFESDFNNLYFVTESNQIFSCDIYGKVLSLGKIETFDKLLRIDNDRIVFSLNDNLYLYRLKSQETKWLHKLDFKIDNMLFLNGLAFVSGENKVVSLKLNLP